MLRELNIAREPFILFSKEKPYRVHVVLCLTADKKCAASALFQWNGLGTCVDDDSRYFKILGFTYLATCAGTKQMKCLTSNT